MEQKQELREEKEEKEEEERPQKKLKMDIYQEYLLSLSEKERIAWSISEKMLKINLKDTIGFQHFLKEQSKQQGK
jgi:hypothetical protein